MDEDTYTVVFSEPHMLTDDGETELEVDEYDDLGSMIRLELTDGSARSVGKQLVDDIVEHE